MIYYIYPHEPVPKTKRHASHHKPLNIMEKYPNYNDWYYHDFPSCYYIKLNRAGSIIEKI
jgi:hypothetical protein